MKNNFFENKASHKIVEKEVEMDVEYEEEKEEEEFLDVDLAPPENLDDMEVDEDMTEEERQ